MDSKVSLLIKIVLVGVVAALGYWLYSIIQEPIQYEELKSKRYALIQEKLENIREAQKAYKDENGIFAKDFQTLISFIDTGKITIKERKDSSFMRYDKIYQQDMNVDTIIVKVIGFQNVKEKLFGEEFNAADLETVPEVEGEKIQLDATKITVKDAIVNVFEAKADDTQIFKDVLDKYSQFIDKEHAVIVGSLTEPSLSGNWK
tara:strand:- start:758 stop:1366 length:609 start_codon:yes stop_codon:yes gene_type:complete